MILNTWLEVLQQSFQNLLSGVVSFIPNLIVAVVIFIIGWLIGSILARVVEQVIRAIKVDNALRSAGVEDVLGRAGLSLNAGGFLGALVKWFIIVVFLVAALEVLGLTQVNVFLQEVVLLYLPQVIVAVLILLVAAVVAEVMRRVVIGSAKAAGLVSAHFLGAVTQWSIWVFAALTALGQLGVATPFVQTLFTGIVVAVSLAFGLAFGLGGQDAAARFLEKMRQEISKNGK